MASKVHAVGVIFEDSEGRILVLRRHADAPEGGSWGLVGGKVDEHESFVSIGGQSPESCMSTRN